MLNYNMAWLQSSFTSHQLLGDSNHKKGFKSSAGNKDSDPDKSDTPLLHDSMNSPDKDNATSGWLKSTSNNTEKKQSLLNNSSKSSFLPYGLFEKSSGNSKSKMQPNQSVSSTSSNFKKPAENAKLLADENKKKHPLFVNDDHDDDNDEESDDDEWCIPRLGGYQKVRPCTE